MKPDEVAALKAGDNCVKEEFIEALLRVVLKQEFATTTMSPTLHRGNYFSHKFSSIDLFELVFATPEQMDQARAMCRRSE